MSGQWCIWKKEKYEFWKLKKIIYTHDIAIENGKVYHWSLKIKIYMIYFLETLFWINLCPAKN